MRVSRYDRLDRTQGELDFVDVDVSADTRLFVDPRAIRLLTDDWGHECVALIQDFFNAVLQAVRQGDDRRARRLLRGLREPNETRLGLSRGRPRGRALGPESADDVWRALRDSEAARTGLLVDLEDTALLVPGIGSDIVSDIATNLIRLPLIRYTQDTCRRYGIRMSERVYAGPLWNPGSEDWEEGGYAELPYADGRRLLLTPKVIVRKRMEYDVGEYYGDFIIPTLQDRELAANSELVKVMKKRRTRYVTKTAVREKYGNDKAAVIRQTLGNPEVLEQYRRFKRNTPSPPLDHADFVDPTGSDLPDYEALVQTLQRIQRGRSAADEYHRAVERVLSALFSNSLAMPQVEYAIHQGRKRIDIVYSNVGVRDFFAWLGTHYPAPKIYVECKNYVGDPANPELDQLAGRFSMSRGKFGFLVCRSFENKDLFIERCRDTARDDRGFIIALDDLDLAELALRRAENRSQAIYQFLMTRFDELIN
jgi:hypothetical protein